MSQALQGFFSASSQLIHYTPDMVHSMGNPPAYFCCCNVYVRSRLILAYAVTMT